MRAWTTRVARASGGVRDGGWRGDDENMDRDVGARGVVFVRARWRGGAMEASMARWARAIGGYAASWGGWNERRERARAVRGEGCR